MKTHELAKILLAAPDLPVATHAHNHTYMSGIDASSHGALKVGILETYGGQHVVIGDIGKRQINAPNWFVSAMIHGQAPEE